MKGFEFWGIENQDACRARPWHRPCEGLQSCPAPAQRGLGRPWKADLSIALRSSRGETLELGNSRVQISRTGQFYGS
jgi:hypothetical protein